MITMMSYSELCPPEKNENKCLLWMGNIAIRHDQAVNVRTGNAFRFVVKHGIRVSIPELLSLSDNRLRSDLQNAISGAIFRRPNIPGFPADAFSRNVPSDSAALTSGFEDGYPPDWLNSLQERFDQHAVAENPDDGPTLYVMVWFVNGDPHLRCETPRICRLDADSPWWKSEIIFPWRDHFTRAVAFDLHFVDPVPPKETWQSHDVQYHRLTSIAIGACSCCGIDCGF